MSVQVAFKFQQIRASVATWMECPCKMVSFCALQAECVRTLLCFWDLKELLVLKHLIWEWDRGSPFDGQLAFPTSGNCWGEQPIDSHSCVKKASITLMCYYFRRMLGGNVCEVIQKYAAAVWSRDGVELHIKIWALATCNVCLQYKHQHLHWILLEECIVYPSLRRTGFPLSLLSSPLTCCCCCAKVLAIDGQPGTWLTNQLTNLQREKWAGRQTLFLSYNSLSLLPALIS